MSWLLEKVTEDDGNLLAMGEVDGRPSVCIKNWRKVFHPFVMLTEVLLVHGKLTEVDGKSFGGTESLWKLTECLMAAQNVDGS